MYWGMWLRQMLWLTCGEQVSDRTMCTVEYSEISQLCPFERIAFLWYGDEKQLYEMFGTS